MLDHARIRALLPHRHPMVLLDRVESIEPGVRLIATKAVTVTEPCYRDLPDTAPASAYAYPVSLLLESFGQAAAVLWLHGGRRPDGLLPMLAALRDCVLEHPVYPGDVLRHEVLLEHGGEGVSTASGTTRVGDRRVAVMGSFLAVVRPRTDLPIPTTREDPRP
ncbi:beta-hydroxyacyl-ACP dehydratase [Actinosynnema sp. NPDC020468]|uniref:3-hydroxyacyl-ACP dehydratase FabZ family protein n=1 Tax=Actinosynnema sp. NPDC020468 TaxID=3154488 RepID=UPI0033CE75E7